jgi:quercetin 2,3-dioxygenase
MEIIRSNERGYFDHGWLQTYHTFSFADYYNPQRIHFGVLRVVNDDFVEGNQGFGTHPHKNMEIISIPLSGKLAHKDSTGTSGVITPGEVQVMSAGTGVTHSEKNPDKDPVQFLQIWIFPNKKDVTPRYDQKIFNEQERLNKIQLLVSPNGRDNSLRIYQNAFLSRMRSDTQHTFSYNRYAKENGVFVFLLEGKAVLDEVVLNRRDTALIEPETNISIQSTQTSEFLFIEVPMQV